MQKHVSKISWECLDRAPPLLFTQHPPDSSLLQHALSSGQGTEFTEIWYLRRANINYSLQD